MITCPACNGNGGGNGFICGARTHRFGWIDCSFCMGSKEVTEETAERYKQGKEMARERRERRVTSREEAKRLGVDWGEWTRIEYGREPETPEGHAAWEQRLKEMKQMAAYADAVALFPGGDGTQSMYDAAKEAGIEIFDFRNPASE